MTPILPANTFSEIPPAPQLEFPLPLQLFQPQQVRWPIYKQDIIVVQQPHIPLVFMLIILRLLVLVLCT